jgi:hypothetical protein
MRHATILVAILAFTPLASVMAQEPGDGRSWCLRGGTPETCKAFWITEFGASLPLYVRRGGGDPLFTWELGAMGSVSQRGALGAAAFVSAGKGGSQGAPLVGVRARYRHWLVGSMTLDGAVGLYTRPGRSGGLDVTGQAALGLADWIAVTTQVDFFGQSRCAISSGTGPAPTSCPATESFTDVIWYVGARLGAVPGIGAGILAMMAASMASFSCCL